MTKYVVTAIGRDGLRQMVGGNNHYSTYETRERAEQHLKDIIENNSPERIKKIVGTDLQVRETECWSSGDSKRTVFGNK